MEHKTANLHTLNCAINLLDLENAKTLIFAKISIILLSVNILPNTRTVIIEIVNISILGKRGLRMNKLIL